MATAKRKTKKNAATSKKAAKTSARKATKPRKAEEATSATDTGRRRWKDLDVPALQALYAEKVGRPTQSAERTYLIWKIRCAENGTIPTGPSTRAIFGGAPTTAVTVKLGVFFLEDLDTAAKEDGFKSRLGYIRDLLSKGLQVRGRTELASQVAV
jgi:hypothetical protein